MYKNQTAAFGTFVFLHDGMKLIHLQLQNFSIGEAVAAVDQFMNVQVDFEQFGGGLALGFLFGLNASGFFLSYNGSRFPFAERLHLLFELIRSEERRVGKECRSLWSTCH